MLTKEEFIQLAPQFKCPTGPVGEQVGKEMDELNAPQNDWVLSLLNLQPSDKVLEIGFGTGKTLKKVANIVNQGKSSGIELSQTMFDIASENLKKEIARGLVDLQTGNAENLPFPDNTFNGKI